MCRRSPDAEPDLLSHAEPKPRGLRLIEAEQARQHAEALASLVANAEMARQIADRIRSTGRLMLVGMGASHWAGRIALSLYRSLGIDASAEVLSDYIRTQPPAGGHVTLITSQSGASGEIRAYFERCPDEADRFGLTLEPESLLARTVPSLVGVGGSEKAYAATRSLLITIALHGGVLAELGHDVRPLVDVLSGGARPVAGIDGIAAEIAGRDALYLSSRSLVHAVLEAASLTFTELARAPALALELGQLIHGPVESLSARTGLLLGRPQGRDAAAITRVAGQAVALGLRPVIFDLGDHAPVEGALAVRLPARSGLAAAAELLPVVQSVLIAAAARRVPDVGTPLRSSKIADGEAP